MINKLFQLLPMLSAFLRGNQDAGTELSSLLEGNQDQILDFAQNFLQRAGDRGLQSGGNDALTASLLTKQMEKNDQINDEIRRKFLDSSTTNTQVIEATTVAIEADKRSKELERRIEKSENSLREVLKEYFAEQAKKDKG